jgi:16S rRNA (guanine966-N2)-methyltransferase
MKKRTAPRIIAGKLRGIRLKSLSGNQTRPITDRVKENLFNIIGADIQSSNFLDAFSGTGSVGIEAYSRGANFVQFIEKNRNTFLVLDKNLIHIKDTIAYDLRLGDAYSYLKTIQKLSFDYIFIAPPQYKQMWEKALILLDKNSKLLKLDGWLIIQIDPIEYKKIELQSFEEFNQRKYGSTLLVFFRSTNS